MFFIRYAEYSEYEFAEKQDNNHFCRTFAGQDLTPSRK
ncbi:Uncharacterized protein dnm_012020 [Desulfonema magnum]|uniref:Uncharacterized protein n=1 Tax=Desulfonema magnum TaxID=45655 RepID=A0A975GKY2_9BACT|nr:Uncharacterized protein dnm_012020 [Desulfonema magnum]